MKLQRRKQEKIRKPIGWVFAKIKKIDKPLTRLSKEEKKREKTQIINARSEREVINTQSMDIKR